MKRISAFIIAVLLLFSLCSCKSNVEQTIPENTETGEYTEMRRVALAIENKTFTGKFDKYTAEQKEEISSYLKRTKYNITYKDDGSAEIEHRGKKWLIGIGWVQNEFTEGIPEPKLGDFAQVTPDPRGDGKAIFFLIKATGSENFEQYVKRLNEAGFETVGTFPNEDNTFSAVKGSKRINIFFMYKGYQIEIINLKQN